MSDPVEPPPSRPAPPPARVEHRRGLPLIWGVPLLAAAIGAWLAWTTISEKGAQITIRFESASGIESGKTEVRYRDVRVGIVQNVTLSEDHSHVIVTVQMDRSATDLLHEKTEFWIQSVQLTASGLSGLGTLVSGAYIGLRPGEGKDERHFVGLKQPPVLQVNAPGKTFELRASKLGSIAIGSPVYFRGIQVGEVLGSALAEDGASVQIYVFVREPHDALVRPESRFWNASGIDVSLGAGGLSVRTESLQALALGGIAFDTPVEASAGEPSPGGAVFTLYPSYESIAESQFTEKVPYLVYFQGSVAGLAPGAPVVFRGIQVGVVESLHLEIDEKTYDVRIPVRIAVQPQRAALHALPGRGGVGERLPRFIEKGLRAQLRSGSLLTGSMVIALDFFPKEPPAKLVVENGIPVIPSVPSAFEQLQDQAGTLVANLAKAPIPELVADLRKAVQDADALLASKSPQGLGSMIASLKQTSDAARATLAQTETTLRSADGMIGADSALRHDLVRLIEELTRMARSVRTLSDELERNPNALIFGTRPTEDR